MVNNPLKCSLTLVFAVLQDNTNNFLSVREINTLLFENHDTNMAIDTIVRAIDKLKTVNGNIAERIERRGEKRIPVKVFSLQNNERSTPKSPGTDAVRNES